MIYSLEQQVPAVHASCFVAPNAAVIGDGGMAELLKALLAPKRANRPSLLRMTTW